MRNRIAAASAGGNGSNPKTRGAPRKNMDVVRMHADEGIAYHLRDTYRTIARAFQVEGESLDVDTDIGVWIFLRSFLREEGLTLKELTARMGLMQPGASAALKQMEHRGLVTKIIDPEDRRKVRIFLTPKSRELLNALMPTAAKVLQQALSGFSKQELSSLFEFLDRIRANFAVGTEMGAGKPGTIGVAKATRASRVGRARPGAG